jgi:hypothetical protein
MTLTEHLIYEAEKALRELDRLGAIKEAQHQLWLDGWLVVPAPEVNQKNA